MGWTASSVTVVRNYSDLRIESHDSDVTGIGLAYAKLSLNRQHKDKSVYKSLTEILGT